MIGDRYDLRSNTDSVKRLRNALRRFKSVKETGQKANAEAEAKMIATSVRSILIGT